MNATENQSAQTSAPETHNGHITEDEASLYDRQIRLWGLEAQSRMRSSTVLILSLRSIAHETIKNIVLAGIGRLIVMDGDTVTEEDLGGGFLFREEDGAVGKNRTEAALPQIASLNPLVSLTALPTLDPFQGGDEAAMVDFLQKEKVDVVVACDLTRNQMVAIDGATRKAGSMFYGTGTYGFYGYVFADLGENFDCVVTPIGANRVGSSLVKTAIAYSTMQSAMDQTNWSLSNTEVTKGGSPFRGLSRQATRELQPQFAISIMAVWEFEARHGALPSGSEGQEDELALIAEELREALGVHTKALPSINSAITNHLANHAEHFFPPTLAIVGGLVAQDVLRCLSRKELPTINFLAVDSLGGEGTVTRWAMAPQVVEKNE